MAGRRLPSRPPHFLEPVQHVPDTAEIHTSIASRLQMLQTTRGEVAGRGGALGATDSLVTGARR